MKLKPTLPGKISFNNNETKPLLLDNVQTVAIVFSKILLLSESQDYIMQLLVFNPWYYMQKLVTTKK